MHVIHVNNFLEKSITIIYWASCFIEQISGRTGIPRNDAFMKTYIF